MEVEGSSTPVLFPHKSASASSPLAQRDPLSERNFQSHPVAEMNPAQLAALIEQSASPDQDAVKAATSALKAQEAAPGMGHHLLSLCAASSQASPTCALAAAVYFKNLIRGRWPGAISEPERVSLRSALLEALVSAPPLVLKPLAEAFRLVVVEEVARGHRWPELVPALHGLVQRSNLMAGQEASPVLTSNTLVAVRTLLKPYQYFQDPTVVNEAPPKELEEMASQLLAPLFPIFQMLVAATLAAPATPHDALLLDIVKCLHHTVRSYLPKSLAPHLQGWVGELVSLAGGAAAGPCEDGARTKAHKRALQVFTSLVTRHRRHMDRHLDAVVSLAVRLVQSRVGGTAALPPLQDRLVSAAFDLLARVVETAPGWRALSPQFGALLEAAIFPALRMKPDDLEMWEEDPEEYQRRTLPSDLASASGLREDFFTARGSALNLLGVIARSSGPPGGAGPAGAAGKRKMKVKATKAAMAGEAVVLSFLARFAPPPAGCSPTCDACCNYFGVLLAYGSLNAGEGGGFLGKQSPAAVARLVSERVLPIFAAPSPSPYVLACANWLLGEVADVLPESVHAPAHAALVKSLAVPDQGEVSWQPVRASSAAAISSLLANSAFPGDWAPLMSAAAAGAAAADDDEAARSLRLLGAAAESAGEDIVPHAAGLASTIAAAAAQRMSMPPEPYSPPVEAALEALVKIVEAADSSIEEAGEEEAGDGSLPAAPCPELAGPVSQLLQRAWLPSAWGAQAFSAPPAPSSMGEGATLLVAVIDRAATASAAEELAVGPLLASFAAAAQGWDFLESEEDTQVAEVVAALARLQGRAPMGAHTTHVDAAASGLAAVLASAVECGTAAAAARAARRAHALMCALAATGLAAAPSAPAAAAGLALALVDRLQAMADPTLALSKPLALAAAACLARHPIEVTRALASKGGSPAGALGDWLAAAGGLVDGGRLSLESEARLLSVAGLGLLGALPPSDPGLRAAGMRLVTAALVTHRELLAEEDADEMDDESEEEEGSEDSEGEEGGEDDVDEDESEEDEEETEEEFLARYAEAARDLALEGEEGAGDDDIDEDEEELEVYDLQGIDAATALQQWIGAHATASDKGALARLLAAQPVPGMDEGEGPEEFLSSL